MANKPSILEAIERLNFTLKKINDFDEMDLDLSDKILENRIITLEGYIRYLDSEGIPKIKKTLQFLEEDNIDWSNLL